jgi:DNA-binding MurR/RpiR family transcriptional regulator
LFWYVARMALDTLHQVPRQGNLPIDDIANIRPGDVLLAMTFALYRTDIVDAVTLAADRGATIVAISDSRTSPIALKADHAFVTPTTTPQFFPSLSAGFVLIETLLAFVIAQAGPQAVEHIERFHQVRYRAGVYVTE